MEGSILLRTKIAEHYEFEVFLEFLLLALCFFVKFLVFSLFLPNDTNALNDSNEEKSLHSPLSTEKFRKCLVVWEIMLIFAGSKKSFCRKTTDIITTAKGAKLLVLMGLRLCRRRVSCG